MSKEYYRKKIIDLRASLDREKEAKKRDNRELDNIVIITSIYKLYIQIICTFSLQNYNKYFKYTSL